jgi:hypothetical protein
MERHAVDLEALRGERSPPKRRRDCPPPAELCPFIECRYHLWTDRVHRGRVMILAASSAYGDPAHFCALHEADRGPKTLEQVGVVYGVSRERIRQLEAESMAVLRAVNPSLLRELLSVVDDISCETEPPCDDPDDGAVAPRTATAQPPPEDACDSTSSAADVCDLVSDQTEASPWCEPTSTDPRVQAINEKKVARATARAANATPYWCPHCGRTYPGIGIEGNARKGCPNPRCAGQAWADRARQTGRKPWAHEPAVVEALVRDYRPGVHGYRALAREHHLPVPTVAAILRRVTRGEG